MTTMLYIDRSVYTKYIFISVIHDVTCISWHFSPSLKTARYHPDSVNGLTKCNEPGIPGSY